MNCNLSFFFFCYSLHSFPDFTLEETGSERVLRFSKRNIANKQLSLDFSNTCVLCFLMWLHTLVSLWRSEGDHCLIHIFSRATYALFHIFPLFFMGFFFQHIRLPVMRLRKLVTLFLVLSFVISKRDIING